MVMTGGVVRGSGTGTVALHDAMPGETTTTGRLGETETSLMIGEAEADDAVIGAMADLEAEPNRSAGKAQALRPRRRSPRQT